jgi:hypothetical protein
MLEVHKFNGSMLEVHQFIGSMFISSSLLDVRC